MASQPGAKPVIEDCEDGEQDSLDIHSTLRTSPAMAAGVTDRLWEVSDLVDLLIASESNRAA